MPPDTPQRRCSDHEVMSFKNTLALSLMGGNLLCLLLIAISAWWANYKTIPDFKAAVVAEMAKTQQRAEVVEYRIATLERVANKYLKDVEIYESNNRRQ